MHVACSVSEFTLSIVLSTLLFYTVLLSYLYQDYVLRLINVCCIFINYCILLYTRAATAYNMPYIIPTKCQSNWFSSFRGEDFWNCLQTTTDDGRRRTHSDGISSHGLRPGELKKEWASEIFFIIFFSESLIFWSDWFFLRWATCF